MSSIQSWLQRIGLDRYAETFAAEDIDVEVLPELTEADLVELGVSFGDRKKLLRAIATLTGPRVEGIPLRMPPATAPEAADDFGAEHRHLTVMFCARKSVVSGKSVSVRVDLGGSRIIKQK